MRCLTLSVLLLAFLMTAILGCKYAAKDKPSGKNILRMNKIGDFNNYKREFNIKEIKYMGTWSSSRLDFYADSPCGLKYQKDRVSKIDNYEILFDNKSNAQVEILTVSSPEYAAFIVGQLDPFVKEVRSLADLKQNRNFCISYYLSRIYNYTVKGNKIYLFGYDGPNTSSESIELNDLEELDAIANALR